MKVFLAFAGAISLAFISSVSASDMSRCLERSNFTACHSALNR